MQKWLLRGTVVLVGLLGLTVAVLLAMGQRPDAGTLRFTITIAAPAGEVWTWLVDPAHVKKWVRGLEKIEDDPAGHHVGARQIWTMYEPERGGQRTHIVAVTTEFAAPVTLTYRLWVEGMVDGEQSYRLTQLSDGRTRLEGDGRYRYSKWFFRLLEPLITPAARKRALENMGRLKAAAESGAAR